MSHSASDDLTLSPCQRKAMHAVLHDKRHVFLTGPAGSGKTFLVNLLVQKLQDKYGASRVAKTASTGCAATMIRGTTIHSFMRMGLATEPVDHYVRKITKDLEERFAQLRVLIIDEMPMLSGHALNIVEAILRSARGSMSPFGGVQILAVGDFFQLPPIPPKDANGKARPLEYVFQSTAWNVADFHCIELAANFRQKDRAYLKLLDWMRGGMLPPETETILKGTRQHSAASGIEPTLLYCRNAEVAAINRDRLDALPAKAVVLPGTLATPSKHADRIALPRGLKWVEHPKGKKRANDDVAAKQLLLSCRMDIDRTAPSPDLTLKEGAQVMLTVNETASYELTPDRVLVNGSRGVVTAIEPDTKDVFVRFQLYDGLTRTVRVKPYVWSMEVGNRVHAAYQQLPLTLAYALSVHKSQGMTITHLKINLQGCFAPGQAYVAFSRATDRKHLEVEYFDTDAVRVDPTVLEWYMKTFPKSNIARRVRRMRRTQGTKARTTSKRPAATKGHSLLALRRDSPSPGSAFHKRQRV